MVQSAPPGVKPQEDCGHGSGLWEKSPPLTIQNDTVSTVDSFRFLGTTISQVLKWFPNIYSVQKMAKQRIYCDKEV